MTIEKNGLEAEFNREMRRLAITFSASYLLIAVILSSLFLYGYHLAQSRLAQSYAQASRHNLILGDLREAISSVQPAITDGFASVGILDSDSKLAVGLPSNTAFTKSQTGLNVTVRAVIQAEAGKADSPVLAKIIFVYSLATAIVIAALASMVLFLFFAVLFVRARQRLRERYQMIIERTQAEAAQLLAAQVSHDIRSPLGALSIMVSTLTEVPDEKRALINSAMHRINGIASDILLISKGKTSRSTVPATIEKSDEISELDTRAVQQLLEAMLAEKRLQYRGKPNISFLTEIDLNPGLRVLVNEKELSRALSNLLNNAVEALPASGGCVGISLSESFHSLCICINDNGKGIPTFILSRLGKIGVSHGKNSPFAGTGLGLAHARKTLELIGGKLVIESSEGEGTAIKLIIPRQGKYLSETDKPRRRRGIALAAKLGPKSQNLVATRL
jgi:signal transduction histidine kinase